MTNTSPNSSADYFDYAVRGLEKMGDEIGLEITLKAKRLLFGEDDVPKHLERLNQFEATKVLDDPEVSQLLDGLDKAFVENYEGAFWNRLTAFALENEFWAELPTANQK